MRTLNWLWRSLLFLLLFAFALNNQHEVVLKWFMGYQWQAPMVFIVLAAFGLGCVTGVLAMVPSWWRQRREARQRQWLMPVPVEAASPAASPGQTTSTAPPPADSSLPRELPFPPDMPAPRKPGK